MARTFLIAGKIGTMLFDGADPFAAERPLDDRRFAIDQLAVKLLKLRDHADRIRSGDCRTRDRDDPQLLEGARRRVAAALQLVRSQLSRNLMFPGMSHLRMCLL
ncbi:hypothetical protein HFO89_31530 [Rhizobium leguminosarum]|uniref:hypothetical protein n=1 Tax=Rhizobium leguminosarum TaxID=384 RepID=UPI001C96F91C|nr:hypothetical protein [Rhizobium leguminosarum]MBY5460808.1 hypothetical protein [Rhizobium leguminosarum]